MSKSWLTECLDPFHDFQYDPAGLPDERQAPSVIQIHNQLMTVTNPGDETTGLWDSVVVFSGLNYPIGPYASNSPNYKYGGLTSQTSSAIHSYNSASLDSHGFIGGSLMVRNILQSESGLPFLGWDSTTSANTVARSLGSVMNTDRCRLVGVGIEVTNTTSDLYKQGSVTVAMLPDTAIDSALSMYLDSAGSWTNGQVQMDRAAVFAGTVSDLQTVPGSCTWPAADGVYAVPRMTEVPRDLKLFSYGVGGIGSEGTGANCRIPAFYDTLGKVYTPEPVGKAVFSVQESTLFYPAAPSGFSPVQIWFTGLSPQTTLTINFRTIVEYFPAVGSTLLPLAAPSPVFDPKVLSLYSAIAARAPYAVPVEENNAGDYFRKILVVMSEALRLTAPMFGQYAPLAAIGSTAMGNASRFFSSGSKIPKKQAGAATDQKKSRRVTLSVSRK